MKSLIISILTVLFLINCSNSSALENDPNDFTSLNCRQYFFLYDLEKGSSEEMKQVIRILGKNAGAFTTRIKFFENPEQVMFVSEVITNSNDLESSLNSLHEFQNLRGQCDRPEPTN